MYPNLKLEMFKRGLHQNRLAKTLGMSEIALSKIIHGYRTPSEAQRKLAAQYFGVDETWLFEEYDGEPKWKASSDEGQFHDGNNGKS
jgi:transcriptional regulator with XRE-family HTH domain